jgi:hypothetical protein
VKGISGITEGKINELGTRTGETCIEEYMNLRGVTNLEVI